MCGTDQYGFEMRGDTAVQGPAASIDQWVEKKLHVNNKT